MQPHSKAKHFDMQCIRRNTPKPLHPPPPSNLLSWKKWTQERKRKWSIGTNKKSSKTRSSPSQSDPLPVNPSSQVQRYEPSVFVQFAYTWQLSVLFEHSSMSESYARVDKIEGKQVQTTGMARSTVLQSLNGPSPLQFMHSHTSMITLPNLQSTIAAKRLHYHLPITECMNYYML